jgi:hypothetical protein
VSFANTNLLQYITILALVALALDELLMFRARKRKLM